MTIDRDDILRRLRAGRDSYLSHADGPEADLAKAYAPEKWTTREILAHLADCEIAFCWRFLKAAGEPGTAVENFEEDAWAARMAYATRPVAVSRGMFVGAREALCCFVAELPEDRLAGESVHPVRGTMLAWQWASLTANHARHHLGQADAARAGKPWVKLGPVTA